MSTPGDAKAIVLQSVVPEDDERPTMIAYPDGVHFRLWCIDSQNDAAIEVIVCNLIRDEGRLGGESVLEQSEVILEVGADAVVSEIVPEHPLNACIRANHVQTRQSVSLGVGRSAYCHAPPFTGPAHLGEPNWLMIATNRVDLRNQAEVRNIPIGLHRQYIEPTSVLDHRANEADAIRIGPTRPPQHHGCAWRDVLDGLIGRCQQSGIIGGAWIGPPKDVEVWLVPDLPGADDTSVVEDHRPHVSRKVADEPRHHPVRHVAVGVPIPSVVVVEQAHDVEPGANLRTDDPVIDGPPIWSVGTVVQLVGSEFLSEPVTAQHSGTRHGRPRIARVALRNEGAQSKDVSNGPRPAMKDQRRDLVMAHMRSMVAAPVEHMPRMDGDVMDNPMMDVLPSHAPMPASTCISRMDGVMDRRVRVGSRRCERRRPMPMSLEEPDSQGHGDTGDHSGKEQDPAHKLMVQGRPSTESELSPANTATRHQFGNCSRATQHPISTLRGALIDYHDAKYRVGLSLLPGIGPARLGRLIDVAGSAEAAWHVGPEQLRRAGIEDGALAPLLTRRKQIDLDREMGRIEALGATVLVPDDPRYPPKLAEVFTRPGILYVKGNIQPEDSQALAVVGTRRPSIYGQALVSTMTPLLVQAGLTIVSGLATGIDTIAHRAALQSGGRTLAVLGSGLDVIYPGQNRGLAERIADNGAVVTEYAMGTQPDAFNFPARNRIISGLALGSLIVEAGQKSGALITAGYAVDQNREVFAFPGRISDDHSAGCNRLIKEGRAKLVMSVEDILEELNINVALQQLEMPQAVAENDVERRILSALSANPVHIDELGRQASVPAAEVTSALTLLELRGAVRHVGSMHYVLAR